MRYSLIVVILLVLGCQPKHDVPLTFQLNKNWQFKRVTDTVWRSAVVPGNVFSDLLEHNLIEDPFVSDIEKKVQWVSDTEWEYRTFFSLDKGTLSKKNIDLFFEGLDTYAEVYLNNNLILEANNAFREWHIDAKRMLKTKNELRIRFKPTYKFERLEKQKLPYILPEGNRIFTRKAQFQYGWDWGPKLNTLGVWKPIKLNAWNDFKIQSINFEQVNLNKKEASLLMVLENETNLNKDVTYHIYLNDILFSKFKNPNPLIPDGFIPLDIKNPKLWWPHNLGEPYLYNIKVIVKHDQKILDSISIKKGLRTIELISENDSIGESFYFKVNDVPVYVKGANYIPQHSFQDRVRDADYERLLSDVVSSNMNMLRVWGGGIYENDVFYDLCDEKGIMVWQDFMFACAMYPGDKAFLNNVKKEAEDNVKRLRNHASIALWCGNNENSEGWHRWGWQDDKTETQKAEIWNNYLKVFDSILPQVVSKYTKTDYWESSPKYGRGNPKYKTEGDAHDWWVWHDAYPFEHLEDNVPRFMSEFGFQSFPSYETIRFLNRADSLNLTSKGFENHQKHTRGFQLIEDYMARDFPMPSNPADYIYISQLLQAYGITKGIEAHRRSRPQNMGTLYWQLNDCWPAISWSSIDFFGNWKALHYKAKRSFDNTLITSKLENELLKTWIVNDKLNDVSSKLKFELINFDGNVLWKSQATETVKQSSSKLVHEMKMDSVDFNPDETVMVANYDGISAHFFFVRPKQLKLNRGKVDKVITKTSDGFDIVLSTHTFQKDVFLFTKNKGFFSENFFDMLPNIEYKIHFETKSATLDDLQFKTLNDFLN